MKRALATSRARIAAVAVVAVSAVAAVIAVQPWEEEEQSICAGVDDSSRVHVITTERDTGPLARARVCVAARCEPLQRPRNRGSRRYGIWQGTVPVPRRPGIVPVVVVLEPRGRRPARIVSRSIALRKSTISCGTEWKADVLLRGNTLLPYSERALGRLVRQ